jgi:hypothetical protein
MLLSCVKVWLTKVQLVSAWHMQVADRVTSAYLFGAGETHQHNGGMAVRKRHGSKRSRFVLHLPNGGFTIRKCGRNSRNEYLTI